MEERQKSAQAYQPLAGIARLYEYLAHVKSFPTSLRFAAVVSGMPDKDVKLVLESCPHFSILEDDRIDRGDVPQSIS